MLLDASRGISTESINQEIQSMKELGVYVLPSMDQVPTITNENLFKNITKNQENTLERESSSQSTASSSTSSSSSTATI